MMTKRMYLTPHAAVGVLISQGVDRPLWIFLLSILSHFILDIVPHGDDTGERNDDAVRWVPKKIKLTLLVSAIDLVLLTAMLALLYGTDNLPDRTRITAGVVGAVLPDLISSAFPVIHYYTSWFFVVRLFTKIQNKLRISFLWKHHNWLHRLTHNPTHKQLSFRQGLVLQTVITVVALLISLQLIRF